MSKAKNMIYTGLENGQKPIKQTVIPFTEKAGYYILSQIYKNNRRIDTIFWDPRHLYEDFPNNMGSWKDIYVGFNQDYFVDPNFDIDTWEEDTPKPKGFHETPPIGTPDYYTLIKTDQKQLPDFLFNKISEYGTNFAQTGTLDSGKDEDEGYLTELDQEFKKAIMQQIENNNRVPQNLESRIPIIPATRGRVTELKPKGPQNQKSSTTTQTKPLSIEKTGSVTAAQTKQTESEQKKPALQTSNIFSIHMGDPNQKPKAPPAPRVLPALQEVLDKEEKGLDNNEELLYEVTRPVVGKPGQFVKVKEFPGGIVTEMEIEGIDDDDFDDYDDIEDRTSTFMSLLDMK